MLKRKQRIRVEKGKDRAEAVGDKLMRKREKGRGSGGRGEGRNVSSILFYIASSGFCFGMGEEGGCLVGAGRLGGEGFGVWGGGGINRGTVGVSE